MPTLWEIGEIIDQARQLAVRYYQLTGRPLGITGEVGEYEAARLLNLQIAPARECGFDAMDSQGRRIQIKARSLPPSKKTLGSHRLGSIDLESPWDVVVFILMDDRFQPVSIHEATREAVTAALMAPGSKARNERGALSISKFKSISKKVWPPSVPEEPLEGAALSNPGL